MPKPVTVNVTARTAGQWQICPFTYEDNAGLQKYPDGTFVRYMVPVYAVEIVGSDTFAAVRFGLVNRRERTPAATRQCDAGLFHPRTAKPDWNPTYSPHSFTLPGRPGAWPVYHHFLIHQGSNGSTIGGSLGCIEIVGNGKWDAFLARLEQLAGASCQEIGRTKSLTVNIAGTSYPLATLVTP